MKKFLLTYLTGLVVVGFVELFRSAISVYAGWPIQIFGTAAIVALVSLSFVDKADVTVKRV